jgi:BMFP domain-containing protein YqiC
VSKPLYAIFIDGPAAGRVFRYPGIPEILWAEEAVRFSIPVREYDPSQMVSDLVLNKVCYRRMLRDPMPFGYMPYMLDMGSRFTAVHADAATRMIELLVEQEHAESTKRLVAGYRETTALLTSRLTALEQRLSAVMANHSLSAAVDEDGASGD